MIISEKKTSIDSPETAAKPVMAILESFDDFEKEKEHFFVAGMNTRSVIQYIDLMSIGTVDTTVVHPRDVFRLAILKGVTRIILFHNHPSGDLDPSSDDINITRRLLEGSRILGIKIVDHIIVSESGFLSLKEYGVDGF